MKKNRSLAQLRLDFFEAVLSKKKQHKSKGYFFTFTPSTNQLKKDETNGNCKSTGST